MLYRFGSIAALEKLGMRDIPPLTDRVARDAAPVSPQGNAFDHFDKMVMSNARLGKTAATAGPMPHVNGFRASSRMSFPTPNTGAQMLTAPKPQMARSAGMGGLNPMKPQNPMKAPQAIDPRATKPPGMNLQHQVSENAATMDTANSMTSPQRRFMTPL